MRCAAAVIMKSLSVVFLLCATATFGQSAPELLIPAAGSTPGANGTFFKSDIMLGNFAGRAQAVRLTWLPQGVAATYSTPITPGAARFIRSSDFVPHYLRPSRPPP